MRQVEAIRRATLKAEQAGFHLSSAPPTAGVVDHDNRSPSLNNRERAADGTSERFPREATRTSFDALTFGSGQAEWNHLQRSPHGTLGQSGVADGEGEESGGLGMTRVYSGDEEINLDPSHPSNRLLMGSGGRDLDLATTSFREELARDQLGFNPFSDRESVLTDTLSFGSTNVIPIAFVPPTATAAATTPTTTTKNNAGVTGLTEQAKKDSAMALDAARRELENIRGNSLAGPPTRPRRSPDLDLRLNVAGGMPPPSGGPGRFSEMDRLEYIGRNQAPGGAPMTDNDNRHSYQTSRTTASFAPSYFSSQTDLGVDVPMILTSRQVQLGTRQLAEVVQLSGNNNSPQHLSIDTAAAQAQRGSHNPLLVRSPYSARSPGSANSDPFDDRKSEHPTPSADNSRLPQTSSQQTFGDHEQEGSSAAHQPRDLRFSMGSLALRRDDDRDSMSSFGTGYFTDRNVAVVGEARKVFVGQPRLGGGNMQPPRPAFINQAAGQSRESMMSGRSDADSFLGSFPIIPPSPEGQNEAFPATQLPTSMSVRSMAVSSAASPAPAGPSVPRPRDSTDSRASDRPSILNNDGILSTFPPVPGPRQGSAAAAESAEESLNDQDSSRSGKGLSIASQGLSAFDFRFGPEDVENVPPVPALAPSRIW